MEGDPDLSFHVVLLFVAVLADSSAAQDRTGSIISRLGRYAPQVSG